MIDPGSPNFAETPIAESRQRLAYRPDDPAQPPVVRIVTRFTGELADLDLTAQSVLGQSLQQWEWLIVHEGGSDDVSETEAYAANDPRIRVSRPSLSPLGERQTVGGLACPYLVPLAPGDLLEPTALEKWLWYLDAHPSHVSVGGYVVGFGDREFLWDKADGSGGAFEDLHLAPKAGMVGGGVDALSLAEQPGVVPEYLTWRRIAENPSGDAPLAPAGEQPLDSPSCANGGADGESSRKDGSSFLEQRVPCSNRLAKTGRRALLVLPTLNPERATTYHLGLVQQLRYLGWEVTVAALAGSDLGQMHAFTRCTPDVFVLSHFLSLSDAPRFLSYLVESRAVDAVLLAGGGVVQALLTYLAARHPGTAIVDVSDAGEDPRGEAPPTDSIVDAAIVSGDPLQNQTRASGAGPARLHCVPVLVGEEEWYPSDESTRGALAAELGFGRAQPLVVCAARLDTPEEVRALTLTLLELAGPVQAAVTVVVGAGARLADLKSFVDREGMHRRVSVLGHVADTRLRELLNAADVLFVPLHGRTDFEVLAAMACGVPVVVPDIADQSESLPVDCTVASSLAGCASDEERARVLAGTIRDLLGDAERRSTVGRAARAWVQSAHGIEGTSARLKTALDSALSACSGRSARLDARALSTMLAATAIARADDERRIRELEHANADLNAQCAAFERAADAQRAWVAELEEANAWLSEQRAAWERTAAERAEATRSAPSTGAGGD